MLVLLHGAIKNAGDFLIFERAKALLTAYRGAPEFLEIPRFETLEPHLDRVKEADAIVLCGGPGYHPAFYPRIFPLISDLSKLRPKVVPLGLGYSGPAEGAPFTPAAAAALAWIHGRIESSSVRDVITEGVLRSAGVSNVTLTGCPAWYFLDDLDRAWSPPAKVERLVVTTPAKRSNFGAARKLLAALAKEFPSASRTVVFHRGIKADRKTKWWDGVLNSRLAAQGHELGYEVVDAAYGADGLKFYRDCDLHVGFRVHAHIAFLSHRRPSVLIQEDVRGLGQSRTLGTSDVAGWEPGVVPAALGEVRRHATEGFSAFPPVFEAMRERHEVMKRFVETF